MADSNIAPDPAIPDWWQREKQRRQVRFLVFLCLLLLLIGFFYYLSNYGVTGSTAGVNFDTDKHLVFVRREKGGNTALYAIRFDGTDLHRLTGTDDPSEKSAPQWTLDGKSVVYASDRKERGKSQIYVLGSDEPKPLTFGVGRKDAPMPEPDGKRVGYVSGTAIKEVNLNGTDPYQILPPPRAGGNEGAEARPLGATDIEGSYLNCAFSSDGQSVAGVQEISGEDQAALQIGLVPGEQIVRVIVPGESTVLPLNGGKQVSMAWEPNGKRLAVAFSEYRPHNPDEKDSEDWTQLDSVSSAQGADSKRLLVSGIEIWGFENPKKPTRQLLLDARGFTLTPHNITWSPTGDLIAFEAWYLKAPGVRELRGLVVASTKTNVEIGPQNVNTAQYIVPASPAGQPTHPLWSPDGAHLLYQLQRPDGGSDLCVINADGTNPINLTKGEGDNTQGAWTRK